MFAQAYKRATGFTRPVVISRRYFDRSTDCGCGAFVVINDEGWIVTAAHLLLPYSKVQQDAEEIIDYYHTIHTIEQEEGVPREVKFEKIQRLPENPKWITNLSYWWGMDGVQLTDVRQLPEGDLVVGRLTPFDRHAWAAFPVFKAPEDLGIGTALCKLGYPFQRVHAMFREANNSFELSPAVKTLSCFPMEGLYTRTLDAGKSRDGKYDIKFLETSSPGLRGQSGGPILDANGTIWGVQSRTDHHPYGCIARLEKDGKEVQEDQSINLGIGIHPELIARFLTENGVRFALSDY
ncbi:MAG TPA: trypsin-like peptidase domain-containing protein [Candidatus Deferrimicrobiaceae bacterium]|nr:trypsin-like peptidase domain-containing protein [Candidatus Deferrimicrobiaceae bacterium]